MILVISGENVSFSTFLLVTLFGFLPAGQQALGFGSCPTGSALTACECSYYVSGSTHYTNFCSIVEDSDCTFNVANSEIIYDYWQCESKIQLTYCGCFFAAVEPNCAAFGMEPPQGSGNPSCHYGPTSPIASDEIVGSCISANKDDAKECARNTCWHIYNNFGMTSFEQQCDNICAGETGPSDDTITCCEIVASTPPSPTPSPTPEATPDVIPTPTSTPFVPEEDFGGF
jgi:hypothetical protein